MITDFRKKPDLYSLPYKTKGSVQSRSSHVTSYRCMGTGRSGTGKLVLGAMLVGTRASIFVMLLVVGWLRCCGWDSAAAQSREPGLLTGLQLQGWEFRNPRFNAAGSATGSPIIMGESACLLLFAG